MNGNLYFEVRGFGYVNAGIRSQVDLGTNCNWRAWPKAAEMPCKLRFGVARSVWEVSASTGTGSTYRCGAGLPCD